MDESVVRYNLRIISLETNVGGHFDRKPKDRGQCKEMIHFCTVHIRPSGVHIFPKMKTNPEKVTIKVITS